MIILNLLGTLNLLETHFPRKLKFNVNSNINNNIILKNNNIILKNNNIILKTENNLIVY